MNPLPRSQQSRRRPQRAVGGVAIERPAHPRLLPGNLKLSICRLTRASAVFHVKQGGSRKRVVRGNEWFAETSGCRAMRSGLTPTRSSPRGRIVTRPCERGSDMGSPPAGHPAGIEEPSSGAKSSLLASISSRAPSPALRRHQNRATRRLAPELGPAGSRVRRAVARVGRAGRHGPAKTRAALSFT